MRYSIEELGHAWAYDVSNKRLKSFSGNMWAEGDYCYSYSTRIAYKVPGEKVLLLNMSDYSNTTIKHKYAVMSAFSHWAIIEVPSEYIDNPQLSYSWYFNTLTDMIDNNITYPKQKSGILKRLSDRENFCKYLGTFEELAELSCVEEYDNHDEIVAEFNEMSEACSKYDEARYERYRATDEARRAARQAKINQAVTDLKEYLAGEKELSWSKFVKVAKTNVNNYTSVHCHSLYHLLRGYFNLEEGDSYGTYWAFIWKDGNKVHTSKGVTVDWRDVEVLLKRWKAGKPVLGLKVAEYTITSIDKEKVKIGCHTIPVANLEALYDEEIKDKIK